MKINHRITKLICAVAIMATASSANSQSNAEAKKTYLRVDAGYSYVPKKINSNYGKKPKGAFLGAVGAGYILNSKFKTDFTINYRGDYKYSYTTKPSNYSETQKFSSVAFMCNGYFAPSIKTFKRATPYLMAGAGLAINKANNLNTRSGTAHILGSQKRNFAWQLGVGTLIKLKNNLSADLMYKYVDLGKVTTKKVGVEGEALTFVGPAKGTLKAHEVSLGLNFKF